jgi:hypothetical protein
MFNPFKKSQPRSPSTALAQALAKDGLPPGMEPATLRVVERGGSYSGRHVTYFRVFDPIRASERGIPVRVFADLDAHPDLVLGSGHLEHDGASVVTRHQQPSTASDMLARTEAMRSRQSQER